MRILIVEDEPRAASQLQSLLQNLKVEYSLLGIIDSIEDGVNWFKNHPTPDLVFMDIQLADGLSFEIFHQIQLECPIIFTTAFDQYAIRAFKVNSIDYLLKPIQEHDLEHALDKFNRAQQQTGFDQEVFKKVLSEWQTPVQSQREGILVKDGDGFAQIQIPDLLYIYSEDSVSFGVTSDKRVIIDETLDQLFPTLNHAQFFRINRSQIVAKSAIIKIAKYFNHRLKLSILEDRGQEFIVSRPKTSEFKEWLNR